jgi:hypothetical protein
MPQPSSITSIRVDPAAGEPNYDALRTGIDRIFDQFLQRWPGAPPPRLRQCGLRDVRAGGVLTYGPD